MLEPIVTYMLESPVTPKRQGQHYLGYGSPHRRGYGQFLRFVDTLDATAASDFQDVPSPVTR